MNKKDLRGIDKVIKEKDAVVEIAMGKRNVRTLKVMVENEQSKLYTSFTLNDVLRKASKYLLLNENESQLCVKGNDNIEDGVDWLLTKKFYIGIIQQRESFDTFTIMVKTKSNKKEKVVHSISVFQVEGVYSALKEIDEWAKLIQENTTGIIIK